MREVTRVHPSPRALLVLAVGLTPTAVSRVRSAVGRQTMVLAVDTVREAEEVMNAGALPAMMVVAPRDAEGYMGAELVAGVLRRLDPVTVVGYCSIKAEMRREVIELVSSGVHDVIFAEMDDAAFILRKIFEEAEQVTGAEVIMRDLARFWPRRLRPIAYFCLTYPERARSVGSVAKALRIDRRTLAKQCGEEGFPPPQKVLGWCRLLIAAFLLRRTSGTIESVAHRLDYPSSSTFRNTVVRYLGCRAQELREDGHRRVVDAIEAEIRARRSRAPSRPRR